MDWRVIRNLAIAAFLFVAIAFVGGKIDQARTEHARWDTSPCGTKTFSNGFVLGGFYSSNEANFLEYKDDGVHVWKIKSIHFSGTDPLPVVEWEMAMERTPEACKFWIQKTGIDLRENDRKK